jgi:hypothetical protein
LSNEDNVRGVKKCTCIPVPGSYGHLIKMKWGEGRCSYPVRAKLFHGVGVDIDSIDIENGIVSYT